MTFPRPVVFALAMALMPHSASAFDYDAAAATLRAAADAADEELVDLRRAIWSRLEASQKPAFARRERAWLNEGRAEEQRRCEAGAPASPVVTEQCRLAVAERHRARLVAPLVHASIGR